MRINAFIYPCCLLFLTQTRPSLIQKLRNAILDSDLPVQDLRRELKEIIAPTSVIVELKGPCELKCEETVSENKPDADVSADTGGPPRLPCRPLSSDVSLESSSAIPNIKVGKKGKCLTFALKRCKDVITYIKHPPKDGESKLSVLRTVKKESEPKPLNKGILLQLPTSKVVAPKIPAEIISINEIKYKDEIIKYPIVSDEFKTQEEYMRTRIEVGRISDLTKLKIFPDPGRVYITHSGIGKTYAKLRHPLLFTTEDFDPKVNVEGLKKLTFRGYCIATNNHLLAHVLPVVPLRRIKYWEDIVLSGQINSDRINLSVLAKWVFEASSYDALGVTELPGYLSDYLDYVTKINSAEARSNDRSVVINKDILKGRRRPP